MKKNFCLICNNKTNGINNSINSCRACSVFFRRAILNHKNLQCRRGTNECVIKPGDKVFCKYCQFQKCINMGMIIKKNSKEMAINHDYNNLIEINNDNVKKINIFLQNETSTEKCDILIKENKVHIDMEELISYVNEIFSSTNSILSNYDSYTTSLQRIIIGIKNLFTNMNYNNPENIILTTKIDFKRCFQVWKNFIKHSPKLLMTLEEFSCLPLNDKKIIFSNFWKQAFILISGIYLTKIVALNDKSLILIDEIYVVDIKNIESIKFDIDIDNPKEILDLLTPTLVFFDNFILKQLKNEKYEDIEVAYLILQILFDKLTLSETSTECKRVGRETLKSINDELHKYYVNNKKLDNYVYRITEMSKLLYFIGEFFNRFKEINLVSKFMEIVDLSFMNNL